MTPSLGSTICPATDTTPSPRSGAPNDHCVSESTACEARRGLLTAARPEPERPTETVLSTRTGREGVDPFSQGIPLWDCPCRGARARIAAFGRLIVRLARRRQLDQVVGLGLDTPRISCGSDTDLVSSATSCSTLLVAVRTDPRLCSRWGLSGARVGLRRGTRGPRAR